MKITKRIQKIFTIFITILLGIASVSSAFFLNNKPANVTTVTSANSMKKTPQPITNHLLKNPNNDLISTLQKNGINIANEARRQIISKNISGLNEINSAIDYREQNKKVINYINPVKLKPILNKIIKKTIANQRSYKSNQDLFNGRIYYHNDNLEQKIQVLVI